VKHRAVSQSTELQKSAKLLQMGKSINIKNDEAAEILSELKAVTGKGATELVLEALREAMERHQKSATVQKRYRELLKIARRAAKRVPKKAPSPEAIIGYGPDGLPK
jgi:hypothetical protein